MVGDVKTIQEFAYAGRFSPGQLVAAGVVLGLAALALTWWECRSTRRWMTLVLTPLRILAIAVVLWMLAEPSMRTTVERSHSRSVAILGDASASMGVVDPVQAPLVHWAAAEESAPGSRPLVSADSAAFAVAMGGRLLSKCNEAIDGKASTREAGTLAARASEWLTDAGALLRAAIELPASAGSADAGRLKAASTTLNDLLLPQVRELVDDIGHGRLANAGAEDKRTQLHRRVEELSGTLGALADDMATQLVQKADPATRAAIDHEAALTRRELSAGLLDRLEDSTLTDTAKRAEVLRYAFDQEVFALRTPRWPTAAMTARGPAEQFTDLAAALRQVGRDASGRSIAAAVLVTDGGHNREADPLRTAAALPGVPVYVVPIGNSRPVRDVVLHHVQAPRSVFQNDLVVVNAMLDVHECAGEHVKVEMLQDGQPVDQQELVITGDSFFTPLVFRRKAERMGAMALQLRVAPVPEEQSPENNDAELSVEVTEDKLRVYLADQLPRWEYRFLRNLWKRDDRVVFESRLFDPAPVEGGRTADSAPWPANVDAWARYRVVVLGDVGPAELTIPQQQALGEFVSARGGTLVLIAGDNSMPRAYLNGPLASLLPVEPARHAVNNRQGFRYLVTAEGRTMEATRLADDDVSSDQVWADQLPFYNLSEYSLPKPTAHVLIAAVASGAQTVAGGPQPAFLCWQKYGRGRVLYLAAPVTHRLRYRTGDRYHNRFWAQLLRWAIAREMGTGSSTVRLVTDKTQYQHGDSVQVTVHLSHPSGEPLGGGKVEVLVAHAGQEVAVATAPLVEESDAPGAYHATLKDLPEGNLTLQVGGAAPESLLAEEGREEPVETEIVVEPPLSLELRNTRCNLSLLNQIATATGGAIVPPSALGMLISKLDLTPQVSREVRTTPLWPQWTCLVVFLGALGTEWLVRKLAGLA